MTGQPPFRRRPAQAGRPDSLRDWFPVALDEDMLVWRRLPGRFTAPFFTDALQGRTPAGSDICLTPLDRLDRIEAALAPSALIFHTSRCGSTLLTQLLSTLPACIVLSEPPVLDAFLAWQRRAPGAGGGVARLRQLVLALGQRRSVEETHFFIKLDCWHIQDLALLRAAFPQTPCWFLYREPAAILASHRRRRGSHMVPGLVLPTRMGDAMQDPGDLDGYCIDVLSHIFSQALLHGDRLRWLHYRQLPAIVWQELLPQLGLDCSTAQRQSMEQRTRFHAKDGGSVFTGDPAASDSASEGRLQDKLMPLYALYERMERERRVRGSP